MSTSLEPVNPVATLAPYVGGKNLLHRTITEYLDHIPHEIYAEPFVGMGGIFFKRCLKPRSEVINDLNGDVVTLFRILQNHYEAFMDMLRYQITSRKEFERLHAQSGDMLTDLQRAARFLYIQRVTFGGKVVDRSFGINPKVPGRFDVIKLQSMLADVHERLAAVTIECKPYDRFIELYDRPETLFYLDPPYWGTEGFYGKDAFSKGDFLKLADQLASIKGAFVLSINDAPEVREIFKAFHQIAVPTRYSTAGGENAREVMELIITNRELKRKQESLF